MAISWITALKMVPWGDVIQAAPSVLKAAKGLMSKSAEQELEAAAQAAFPEPQRTTSSDSTAELALQQVALLEARIAQLEQAQHASAQVLQKMAEQQAQIVQTVGILRTGATRLAWGCGVLSVLLIALTIYTLR